MNLSPSQTEASDSAIERFLLERYAAAPDELKRRYQVQMDLRRLARQLPPARLGILEELSDVHRGNQVFETLLLNLK